MIGMQYGLLPVSSCCRKGSRLLLVSHALGLVEAGWLQEQSMHAGSVWVSLAAVAGTHQSAPAKQAQVRLCVGLRQGCGTDGRQAAAGAWRGRLQVRIQPVRAVALWYLGGRQQQVRDIASPAISSNLSILHASMLSYSAIVASALCRAFLAI